ncbi:uncharacterized protein ACMZJ9_001487 [Mantella aurantiaca]
MPSPGFDHKLENIGLRGGAKHPRCRLALTLPGADRLGTASQPHTKSHSPENKLLKLSMDDRNTMTTNSILTTESNLSMLSSNRLLSSSPLVSLTSQSHLTNKLSTSISSSGLFNSSLMSTNYLTSSKASDLDTAFSALTSSVSFSPKCAITSCSSLPSDRTVNFTTLPTENQTFNCLSPKTATATDSSVVVDAAGDHGFCVNRQVEMANLSNSVKHTVTSQSSLPSGFTPKAEPLSLSPESLLLPSVNLQCDIKSNKNIVSHSTVPPSLTSNLQSTILQARNEDFELQEGELPEDDISVNFSEGESLSPDVEVKRDSI